MQIGSPEKSGFPSEEDFNYVVDKLGFFFELILTNFNCHSQHNISHITRSFIVLLFQNDIFVRQKNVNFFSIIIPLEKKNKRIIKSKIKGKLFTNRYYNLCYISQRILRLWIRG